jgi:GGDEF domain-containing protein
MAIGTSSYDYEMDKEYMDVFRRADEAMYANKKAKKGYT